MNIRSVTKVCFRFLFNSFLFPATLPSFFLLSLIFINVISINGNFRTFHIFVCINKITFPLSNYSHLVNYKFTIFSFTLVPARRLQSRASVKNYITIFKIIIQLIFINNMHSENTTKILCNYEKFWILKSFFLPNNFHESINNKGLIYFQNTHSSLFWQYFNFVVIFGYFEF